MIYEVQFAAGIEAESPKCVVPIAIGSALTDLQRIARPAAQQFHESAWKELTLKKRTNH
jgi:hypothetical protein